jgi:hypothetical protein
MRQAALLLATALVACSAATTPGTDTDGGTTDAGPHPGGKKIIEVSGTVQYHPVELAWRAKQPAGVLSPLPSLDGDTFNVEDAIRAQSNQDPLKVIKLSSADGKTATFDVPGVDVTYTTLALVASVMDKAPMDPHGLVFSAYGLGKPVFPVVDTNLPVYVVSKDFVNAIAKAIGHPVDDLVSSVNGFVIAQATKADGVTGSPGARLYQLYGTGVDARTQEINDANTIYLNDDLSGQNLDPVSMMPANVTSNSGVFIRINAGNAATYTMLHPKDTYNETGKVHYEEHLNGSRQGSALMVFFAERP